MQIRIQFTLSYNSVVKSMQFSSLKPMLSYGCFFLQQEKKVLPYLLNQPNPIFNRTHGTIPHKSRPVASKYMEELHSMRPKYPLPSESQKSQSLLDGLKPNKINHRIHEITYPANSPIQDKIISTQLKGINGYMVSVFDGHGGDLLSSYAATKITELLESYYSEKQALYQGQKKQLITDSLEWAYNEIQKNFYEDVYVRELKLFNRKIRNVGSCGLTVIICDNIIYVANCGDSQAILINEEESRIGYKKLNERLSVNNIQERKRLMKEFPHDRDILVEDRGVHYLKGQLQPTKSLGDYRLKKKELWRGKGKFNGPYLTHEPDVRTFPIRSTDQCIVIASDGIWDFVDKWSVSQLSLQPQPHELILNQTLKKVAQIHSKSKQEVEAIEVGERREYHDDITLAVINICDQII